MINMNGRNKIPILIAVAVILLIMIIGFTTQQRESLTPVEKWIGDAFMPVQRVVSRVYFGVEDQVRTLIKSGEIKKENELLKEELRKYQSELIEAQLIREELNELNNLQQTLNNIDRSGFSEPITANVISQHAGNWFQMFTVDAGEAKGIGVNSIVIGSGGLIGRVYETGNHWAKVISIIDNSSSVSFQILRDGKLQGIVSGSVDNELSGYLFDPDADIVVGDRLITSGIGLYPKGILIGEVTEISTSTDQLLQNIEVEPAVNFNRMNKVMIINPITYEE
ncbi:MAG: rod shape-determining protein MreC [Tindallia sp. MSAO_Bac2]|nr:MAG: rod shape-determining protein MreC [Tindallia sp. MSAO_Bac2]